MSEGDRMFRAFAFGADELADDDSEATLAVVRQEIAALQRVEARLVAQIDLRKQREAAAIAEELKQQEETERQEMEKQIRALQDKKRAEIEEQKKNIAERKRAKNEGEATLIKKQRLMRTAAKSKSKAKKETMSGDEIDIQEVFGVREAKDVKVEQKAIECTDDEGASASGGKNDLVRPLTPEVQTTPEFFESEGVQRSQAQASEESQADGGCGGGGASSNTSPSESGDSSSSESVQHVGKPLDQVQLFQDLVRWRNVGAGVVRGGWMSKGFALRDEVLMGNFDEAWRLCSYFRESSKNAGSWELKCFRMKNLLASWDLDDAQRMAVGWMKPDEQEKWQDEIERQRAVRRRYGR